MKVIIWKVICFIVLGVYACNNAPELQHIQVENIDVPNSFDNFLLNDSLIQEYRIIPLETNDESLIANIDHLLVHNNKFYIHDRKGKSLLVFDGNGKYLFKINKYGRGPGEYSQFLDSKIDKNGDILILGWLKVLKYDQNGNFLNSRDYKHLRTKKNGFSPLRFTPLKDEGCYFWTGDIGLGQMANNDHKALKRVNADGEMISKDILMDRAIVGYSNRFYKNTSDGYFMQAFQGNDTIYSISEQGAIPTYFVDFGENRIPPSYLPKKFDGMGKVYYDMHNNTDYCTSIHNIIESKDYIYFMFRSRNKMFEALYLKKNKSVKVGEAYKTPVTNGIEGYNPKTNEYISIFSDLAVATINENRSKYKTKYSQIDRKILDYIDSTKGKFNNPFLVTFKLKRF
jgi:hypothetical protein